MALQAEHVSSGIAKGGLNDTPLAATIEARNAKKKQQPPIASKL